jgi:hypothetical protein
LFASYVPGTVDELHIPITRSAALSAEQQAPISQVPRIPFSSGLVQPSTLLFAVRWRAACRGPQLAQTAAFPASWPQ